jgi:hypothetical protein
MAVWYNIWPFGILCGHLVYFSQFGMFGPRKIWQPFSGLKKISAGKLNQSLMAFRPKKGI